MGFIYSCKWAVHLNSRLISDTVYHELTTRTTDLRAAILRPWFVCSTGADLIVATNVTANVSATIHDEI